MAIDIIIEMFSMSFRNACFPGMMFLQSIDSVRLRANMPQFSGVHLLSLKAMFPFPSTS